MTKEEKRADATRRSREWRAANPQKHREQKKRYAAKHREKELARGAAKKRRWRAANPETSRARVRAWQAKNPEKMREIGRRADARQAPKRSAERRANPGKHKDYMLQWSYGITLDEYNSMLHMQGGVCKICRGPASKKGFHLDHCHTTGEVRGVLCSPCNVGIGMLKDDPQRLRAAAEYLESYQARAGKR